MWKATGIGFMARWPPGYDAGGGSTTRGDVLRPPAADEVVVLRIEADRGDPDRGPGVGCLDHGAAADVHGHVVAATRTVEEEVTGLEIGHADRGGGTHLLAGGAGEVDPGLGPGPLDQPRAVEADTGRL